MANTRKNRSLKKNPKGLKKKSNKSSRKSKKSRRVNKRKIRGGIMGLGKLNNDDFINITETLKKSEESTSNKIDVYIAATKHIIACNDEKSCETDKFVSYTHRVLLGRSLQESDDYNDVSEEKKVALENQINVWGKLAAQKRRKSLPSGEDKNSPE